MGAKVDIAPAWFPGMLIDRLGCLDSYAYGLSKDATISIEPLILLGGKIEPGEHITALRNTKKTSAGYPSMILPEGYTWEYIGLHRGLDGVVALFSEYFNGELVVCGPFHYHKMFWGFDLWDCGRLFFTTKQVSGRVVEPYQIERVQ